MSLHVASVPPTPQNKTLLQSFEWHTTSTPPQPDKTHATTSHYTRLTQVLPLLAELGITSIWVPPGCKANNPKGNGYDVYDLWDLGEFDQKWARSTKWGSREELGDLIDTAHRLGLEVIWDAVLNHKTAGDATEECWAVEVDEEDRRIETCAPKKVEPWIRYDFPGRGDTYSAMKWHAEHFNGTDYDQKDQKHAIFKLIDDPAKYPKPGQEIGRNTTVDVRSAWNRLLLLTGRVSTVPPRRPGKGWAEDVDDTHGNYDYLMFSNVDYTHPEVRNDVLRWGEWMLESSGVDGFRLDAAQHFSSGFSRDWISKVQETRKRNEGREMLIVGEVWTGQVDRITRWLDAVGQGVRAFDAPLLYNFSRLSTGGERASKRLDLRDIARGSLLDCRPQSAVTIVTNHDTQPGQTSYTPINARLKTLFYAYILLREESYPCVFWGDVFGTEGPHKEPPACPSLDGTRSLLPDLVLARRLFAYGAQTDYYDNPRCIAWSRAGTHDRPGCVVLLSISPAEQRVQKRVPAGRPGEKWLDILDPATGSATVTIDEKGLGDFSCQGMSAAVFVKHDVEGVARFPVDPLGSAAHQWNNVYRHARARS